MAALMKATIERDLEHPIETTNKQETISLKQARMMKQRPPALITTPTPQEQDEDEAKESKQADEAPKANDGSGLGLSDFGLDKPSDDQKPSNDRQHDTDDKPNHEPIKPLGSNPLGSLDTGPVSLLPEPS